MSDRVSEYRNYLAELLVAIERCVYFLDGSCGRIPWPLYERHLAENSKDLDLFMALSTVNERFAKLQDTLGAAMRHAALLAGEPNETFLKTLSYFEKIGVLSSIETWQEMRALRNMAAHEYGIEYAVIAEHFNTLYSFVPQLICISDQFTNYCESTLGIRPADSEFMQEVQGIVAKYSDEAKD